MNIAPSVKIYPFCEIKGNVEIGENTIIGSHSVILGDVKIGKNCRIQSFAFIPSGVTIDDDVFIAPRVTILNDKYPPSKGEHWQKVRIMDRVSIGGNVTILPGVVIGMEAKIGAGSVVTKNIEPYKTVYGNPAR
jgi:UDP-2-acetamido-3-amino-2,3-dideoxy-glucuronate N-acetyltransferase